MGKREEMFAEARRLYEAWKKARPWLEKMLRDADALRADEPIIVESRKEKGHGTDPGGEGADRGHGNG
jgi:hypothetical protein